MNLRLPLLIAAFTLPSLAHAAEKLNVKLGLWETVWTTETHGLPPLPKELLDRMSPDQRKKMEADLRAEQAKGPDTNTDRECITQKDLDKPFEPSNTKECTHTMTTTTRTTQEVRIVCSGGMPGSGTMKVTASNPETMTGSMNLKLGDGQNAMTIKGQMKGRWLGSDCGDEADDESDADSDADADADADTDADSDSGQ